MKVTIKGWLALRVPTCAGEQPSFCFCDFEPGGRYYVAVKRVSFDLEAPDNFDMHAAIDSARAKKLADLQENIARLEAQRSELEAA